MLSPTSPRLLWQAAGNPRPEGAIHYEGRCLWCGQDAEGTGRDRKTLPDTFFDAVGKDCADMSAPHLCAACGWTLSDGVRLPLRVGARLLDGALAPDGDGRVVVDLGNGAFRAIVVDLEDRLGVWERPGKAPEEARVRAARDLATVRWVGSRSELVPMVCGKFRNFHAFATASRWEMFTSGEKPAIREILFHPPAEPWTLTIGDGQKHEAIFGEVSYPGQLQTTRFQGSIIHYEPETLQRLVRGIEALSLAGAREEEILAGRYSRSTLDFLRALREHEPTLTRHRGGPILGLALFLRRPVAELREDIPKGDNQHERTESVAVTRDDRGVDASLVGRQVEAPAHRQERPPVGGQCSLF